MSIQRKPLLALLPLFAVTLTSANAAQPTELENIVVTGTRTPRTADDSLQSVTLITREEIEQSQARDLMGLLEMQAGINVARTGGPGKGTSIYMRGTESRHVLVLIDGVRAAGATLGVFDWNTISPDQIDRIEIVRGPRASLYGSDAIGGVIQIFTRKTQGATISLKAGSYGTQSINASLGGGEDWKYTLNAGHEETSGTPIYRSDKKNFGFERDFIGGQLQGKLTDDLTLTLQANQSMGRNKFDASTGNSDFRYGMLSLQLQHQVNAIWKQSLTLGQMTDHSKALSPTSPSTVETLRNSISWQHDLSILNGLFSIGIDHFYDHATVNIDDIYYGPSSINARLRSTGYFAQHQFEAFGSDWQIGARADQHSVYGQHNTWNIAWGRDLGHGFRLTSGYGTAFKAPSVDDLYWPSSTYDTNKCWDWGTPYCRYHSVSSGYAQLQPETSTTAEVGLRYVAKELKASASVYESKLKQLIDWTVESTITGDGTAASPRLEYEFWHPGNINSARIRGLELMAETTWKEWTLRAAYTNLQATDLESHRQLDRRPKDSFQLKTWRNFGAHRVILETEAYSERLDKDGSVRLPGYAIVNAGYEYAFNKELALGIRVDNVFDKDYALAFSSSNGFYAAPGRSAFASVRYNFR